ncbi:hypothetical protein DY125_07475 [Apilactobacillus micheneri]|nr:hypothetical protein DY125_07475 [Apilactobacillus micheneri]
MIMDKTIKKMSQEMGINKLRIYRFIDKNNIKSSKLINGAKAYDKASQELIYNNFVHNYNKENNHYDNLHDNDEAIAFIKNEIEEKNKQIDNLQRMLDQQQQLSLQDKQTISEQKEKLKALIDSKSKDNTNDNKNEKRNDHWWHFWN